MSLKCPECGEILEGVTCDACGGSCPQGSRYCCWCGKALASEAQDSEGQETAVAEDDEAVIDLATRVLCSDGTCIGVVGPDGRCKECGKPYVGEAEEEPDV